MTGEMVRELAARLEPGDTIVDGGNRYHRDGTDRARQLQPGGIRYADCGTRGGVRSAPVIGAALYGRFESRGDAEYEDQLLSAMRKQFGGHEEKRSA